MPRISYVRWPRMNDLTYGYLFDLRTVDELLDYWEDCRKGQILEGYRDYMHSAEYGQATGRGGGHHASTRDGCLLATLVITEQLREKRRSIVELYADTQDIALQGMMRTLRESGSVLINRNGGYFAPVEDMLVTDTHMVDEYVLPGSKITITRWPNGDHWYGRVGGADVEMFGRKKWDSYEEALSMAKRWASERSIAIEAAEEE